MKLNIEIKKSLVDKVKKDISINDQCKLLGLPKSSLYYSPCPEYNNGDIEILHRMDEIYTDYPYYGYRKIYYQLKRERYSIGKDRVLKYMQILGLQALYPKKKLSVANKEHKIYPYLLRNIEIIKPNQVWASDITYIRMIGGFIYLVCIIDWYSKYLLSYKLSNSMDVYFCQSSLYEALKNYNKPEIFNTDQGSQFTSIKFTNILNDKDIEISMDSKGRALDNVVIERFFRSLKYENVYINEYRTIKEVEQGIGEYINCYNHQRLHQSLEYNTPFEIYSNLKQLTKKL